MRRRENYPASNNRSNKVGQAIHNINDEWLKVQANTHTLSKYLDTTKYDQKVLCSEHRQESVSTLEEAKTRTW